jgi:hypothetical protein
VSQGDADRRSEGIAVAIKDEVASLLPLIPREPAEPLSSGAFFPTVSANNDTLTVSAPRAPVDIVPALGRATVTCLSRADWKCPRGRREYPPSAGRPCTIVPSATALGVWNAVGRNAKERRVAE